MAHELDGRRVAALVTHGFEQSELLEPKRALEEAGARVEILAPQSGTVRGWQHTEWGEEVRVDRRIDDARADEYDAVLLPGGVMSPDKLRLNASAVSFVRNAFDDGKPIAVICHGPWMLVEAGAVQGLRMTSWPSLKTDVMNAGGLWVDEPVVVDRGVVSSRKPDDLPEFNRKAIEVFAAGRYDRRPVTAGVPSVRRGAG